jgi:3,4-dihydroxy-2-butanone 4-phosphate synthase
VKSGTDKAVERIERALESMRAGKIVILVDDEDRENEGDLCMAAEKVTPAAVNFMAKHGRGLICLSLAEEKVARLRLPLMVDEGQHQLLRHRLHRLHRDRSPPAASPGPGPSATEGPRPGPRRAAGPPRRVW